jgi:cell division protein FtsL
MSLLDRRVRGFRLVDLVAFALLVMLVLGVYLAKTMAGRERAEIATAERSIGEEKARIRLLQAEVAHLEEPARLERLSQSYLGLAPVPIKHDLTPEGLYDAARAGEVGSTQPVPAQPPRAMAVGGPQPR